MRIFVGSADSNCAQHTEGFIKLCYLSPLIKTPTIFTNSGRMAIIPINMEQITKDRFSYYERRVPLYPDTLVFRLDFTGSSVGLSGIIKRVYAIDWLKYSVYRILF